MPREKLTKLSTEKTIVNKHVKKSQENSGTVDNLLKLLSQENSAGKKKFTLHH